MFGHYASIGLPDDAYRVNGAGDGIGQESHIFKLGRKTTRRVVGKGQARNARTAHPKLVQFRHEGLVGPQPLVADARKTRAGFHRGHRVAEVVGLGAVPLAVAPELVAPDVIQPRTDQFHFRCIQRKPGDFAVIDFQLITTFHRNYLALVERSLAEMNAVARRAHQYVAHGMGVSVAESGEERFALVRASVLVFIVQEKKFGTLHDVGAVFVGQDTHRNRQSIGPDGGFGFLSAVQVINNENLIFAFGFALVQVENALKGGMRLPGFRVVHQPQQVVPLNVGDRVERVHAGRLGPEPPGVVEGQVDGIDDAVFLAGDEFDHEAFGQLEARQFLRWRVHLRAGGLRLFVLRKSGW